MNRRRFLKTAALAAGCLATGFPGSTPAEDAASNLPSPRAVPSGQEDDRFIRPAMFYKTMSDDMVQCQLCPWQCIIREGHRGRCGVRQNQGGEYETHVYGRVTALNNDPIEKKPFNHFRPGTMALSLGASGCNLTCKFCQNWQISQFRPEEVEARYLSPQTVVELAQRERIPTIALTYNEPTVFFEYMVDVARKSHEAGISCVVVSNGFINRQPVEVLAPFLSAYKVDLKAYTEKFYQDMCGARLKPVLKTMETLVRLGLWLEIVNLVLPTANDAPDDIRLMAGWIKANLGASVPLHFTQFRPMYKIRNLPPTPVATLETCHAVAKDEGLQYVYIGNLPGHPAENTYCHACSELIIRRTGLWAVDNFFKIAGQCPACGAPIPGVWS